ncbi:hypothetical protein BGZ83_001012 [Gryganskiella cystojenkinii]|nr:hypothetical protein BGZ83_001012 [Gryganskiella cystojenkinii]
MKKLSIHLDNNEDASHSYYPGNSVTGNVRFDTSASVKYTCVKIRFVGTVATKLAKTTEEVYVLSDQVVLLGNANNASESVLPQGRHCWSFAFDIPLQHIPSTGKYRHGTVKYTLTATVASKSFLGSMQEIKSNKTVQVQDLVSCRLEPYCNPVAVQGSSNTKPDTNKPKNLASATVHLPQSAFVKGQNIQIVLDLAHPRAFHRDPACWIQLVRKESYRAGE